MNFTEKFYKEDGFLKNIYITQEEVMGSDEDYGDLNAFLSKINAEKKGMLDTHIKVKYEQMFKYILFEEENGIQLFFKQNGKDDKTYLQFGDKNDYNETVNLLKVKCSRLQPKEESSGSVMTIVKPLLYTFVVLMFSFMLVFTASEIEAGETVRASGGRRGLKTLFIYLAGVLGFWGSLVVGVAFTLGFIFYTYKVYKNSKTLRTVYSI